MTPPTTWVDNLNGEDMGTLPREHWLQNHNRIGDDGGTRFLEGLVVTILFVGFLIFAYALVSLECGYWAC